MSFNDLLVVMSNEISQETCIFRYHDSIVGSVASLGQSFHIKSTVIEEGLQFIIIYSRFENREPLIFWILFHMAAIKQCMKYFST